GEIGDLARRFRVLHFMTMSNHGSGRGPVFLASLIDATVIIRGGKLVRWRVLATFLLGLVAALPGMQSAAAQFSFFGAPPIAGSSPIRRTGVSNPSRDRPGTIVINTGERRLYYVLDNNQAIRYGIGVGRPGFAWGGVKHVSAKREWPDWTPPADMLRR